MTVTDAVREAALEVLGQQQAIAHIDLDCFYCQVEQQRLGISADVPLAVQQWQGLVAVNYAARAHGITRADTVRTAREKCPGIRLVHVATYAGVGEAAYHDSPHQSTHKVSLDVYRRASGRVMEVLRRVCPQMRKASVDEAYLDVTSVVRERILADLAAGRVEWADSVQGTPLVRWHGSRKGKETDDNAATLGVVLGLNDGVSIGWSDLQLRYAAEVARQARTALLTELGFTSSGGVAHTRILAKIGSAMHKPAQQTVVRQEQALTVLHSLPFSRVPSLGGQLGMRLETYFDAHTLGDLADLNLEQLVLKLGAQSAQHVYRLCRGMDDSTVAPESAPQTLSAVKALRHDPARALSQLASWAQMNSADLWTRVLAEWEERRRWPRTLAVGYTPANGTLRTCAVPFPSRLPAANATALVNAVMGCLQRVSAEDRGMFPVASLQLTARGFCRERAGVALMRRWLAGDDKNEADDKGTEGDDDGGDGDGDEDGDNDDEDDEDDDEKSDYKKTKVEDIGSVDNSYPFIFASPPPLVPSPAVVTDEVDSASSDSDSSCLRTPQETESDAEEADEGLEAQPSTSSAPSPPPAPSRSTTASARRRSSVYIQSSADLESAARYGEGYRHMNIDRHDDGSLVVANEASDNFVPALIAATRRKREIQIFRFQNAVDAPEGAIGAPPRPRDTADGQLPAAGTAGSSSAMAASAEPADSSGDADDVVLDMAVHAMMESLNAAQTVMRIRCPQCPESSEPINSSEWATHCDWHIARQLQERELRHEQAAQHIREAFANSTPVESDKRAREEATTSSSASSAVSSSASSSKRRQRTIGEAWKQTTEE
ncbi:N-acetyltransferase eso1 [Coemansia sp. Benny D115]|nr:N-acetyltransferase eso1 [Coemansia sp. Benny D115]